MQDDKLSRIKFGFVHGKEYICKCIVEINSKLRRRETSLPDAVSGGMRGMRDTNSFSLRFLQ
jgi:hypothetical protein